MSYRAIAFAPDGEYITEGEFKTVDEAWATIADWGSRWIFYPFTGVVKNKRVLSICEELIFLSNKDIKTIVRHLEVHGEDLYRDMCGVC